MKLLVVDDHAGVRAMIRELAGPGPVDVRECGSADAAIALAGVFDPDIITIDARMPGLGGIETTRVLRNSHPDTPIVIVTAYNLPSLQAAAFRAGATDFVAKDDLAQLRPILARVRAAVRRPDSTPSESDPLAMETGPT